MTQDHADHYIEEAKTEKNHFIPWWKENKAKRALPAQIVKKIKQYHPDAITDCLQLAYASITTYEIFNEQTNSYDPYTFYSDYTKEDGSWLWTLYLMEDPLAKQAILALLKSYSHDELPINDWFQEIMATYEYSDQVRRRYVSLTKSHIDKLRKDSQSYLFIPFSQKFFRYIKAIYKRSELIKDRAVWAQLTYHFDSEKNDEYSSSTYSHQTKHYLQRRSWRTLRQLGKSASPEYVEYATDLLLHYRSNDFRWVYDRDPDTNEYMRYCAGLHLWVLNHILYHHSEHITYKLGQTWKRIQKPRPFTAPFGDFTQEEAFPSLWKKRPDLLFRLLTESDVSVIQEFAAKNLWHHQQVFLKDLSDETITQLVQSNDKIPNRLGLFLQLDRLEQESAIYFNQIEHYIFLSGNPDQHRNIYLYLQLRSNQWSTITRTQFAQKLLHRPFENTNRDVVEIIHQILAGPLFEILPLSVDFDLVTKWFSLYQACSRHWDKRYFLDIVTLLIPHLNPQREHIAGDQLLPFLRAENDPLRYATRQLLQTQFAALQLDERFLADLVTTSDIEEQTFAIQFLQDKILWLIPLAEHLLSLLWVRMLRSDIEKSTRQFIRDQILGDLLIHELNRIPLCKIVTLLESDDVENQTFAGKVLLQLELDATSFTPDELLRIAHNPIMALRQQSYHWIQKRSQDLEDSWWVNLAETDWDDTHDWALSYIEQYQHISNNILYGLLDTSRQDIQSFAFRLIEQHRDQLDMEQLMLRTSESPYLHVQAYALQLAVQITWNEAKLNRCLHFFRTLLLKVNQGRKAKQKTYQLLLQIGKQSEEMAQTVCHLLMEMSHSNSQHEFETVLHSLIQLSVQFPELADQFSLDMEDM
ncbi:hypothetical protein IC619_014560 [Hazenella sp. IB182353]|uniref:hypothetical protein n=1 Tax=Polycladospora coralii TaxID=2771432 RepID=UPI001746692D|nr:hypothetical protein [Polycladospora coralii]MBS7531704.1 hypothetical protein [Polycladospora coralii]